jgi:hypothetical protein
MLPLGLRRSLPLGGELISPTCSSDSISTLPDFYSPLSESSTSVADEGVVILMEDFHMSKGAVPLHTASRSIDDAHVVPSYLLPNINTFSTGQRLPTPTSYPNPQATVRPVRPARSKSRPRPQKAAAYKCSFVSCCWHRKVHPDALPAAKPCKFYKLEGVCPSGEQCTL